MVAPHAGLERGAHFGARGVILELGQRVTVELGIAAHATLGIDECHAMAHQAPQAPGRVGPGGGIGGEQRGDDTRLVLEAARDLGFEVTAQQLICGDDQTAHGGGEEQARAEVHTAREGHARFRPVAGALNR